MKKDEKLNLTKQIAEIKTINHLSDCSKEHILKLIDEGYYCGEVFESFEYGKDYIEIQGWWSLEKGRVSVELQSPDLYI